MEQQQHIQSYLRHAAMRQREVHHSGPFLATFTAHSNNPFLNYAIPDQDAAPSPEDIVSLIGIFQQRSRIARLEYIPSLAPAVEPALIAAGFTVEERMPLMVCTRERFSSPPLSSGVELLVPRSEDEIRSLIKAQNEAYGEANAEIGSEDIQRQHAFQASRGISLLARDNTTGDAIGGGSVNVPYNQTAELTSVGVRAAYRRRGIAAALTAHLVQLAWEAEIATVFLMAAHEAEARIYARVGFEALGEVLDIRSMS